MARYKTIDIRIWMDEKFLSLDEGTKLLFIYLLTSQHTTPIGTLSLPSHVIAAWLQNDIDTVSKRLDELSQKGLIKVSSLGLIWIRNYLKYNPPANPKVAVGYCKFFDEMPECALQGDVAKAVICSCKSRGKEYLDAVKTKLQIYIQQPNKSDCIETVSEWYRNQEQEQEQDIYIHNKQHTQVCNEGSAAEDGVCSGCFDESSFDPDEVIDAPIKVQAAQAQLEHFDSVADDQPLSLAQLITGCKQLGIKLGHTPKTEAIASRETITKEVLRECAKAWKGTNTGTGYFVGILENASKDVNTVIPREKRELGPDTITDKQASFFASKLVRDSGFCSKFGKGYQDYNVFASKVAANIRNPRHFDEYKPYMERIGLLGGEQ